MVLIVLLIHCFSFFNELDCDLLSKYAKTIRKELSALDQPNLNNLQKLEYKHGELFQFHTKQEDKKFLLVQEVAACKLGGCSSFTQVNDDLASEYFDVMIILNADLSIMKIKILDYFSDYGYEVNSKRYLKKFIGKKVCLFSKDEDGIDAISGATISSYALEGILSQLCFLDSISK